MSRSSRGWRDLHIRPQGHRASEATLCVSRSESLSSAVTTCMQSAQRKPNDGNCTHCATWSHLVSKRCSDRGWLT